MKVEFLSKYGLVAAFAEATNTVCISMASGMFVQSSSWAWLDQEEPEDEYDPLIGTMLVEEGLAVAQFSSIDEANIWLTNVQQRLEVVMEDRPHYPLLMTVVFDQNGSILTEGNFHTIRLQQEEKNESKE